MHPDSQLLRTKLAPPRLQRRMLERPALLEKLRGALDYRLTIVQAGTGYSKTTALAALAGGPQPLIWYSIGPADADPQRFLSYLVEAFRLRLPGLDYTPLVVQQERQDESGSRSWIGTLDALINALDEALTGPALLVLDDYHLVAAAPETTALIQYFATYLPPDLHIILATRHPVTLPAVARWRARGEVLDITRDSLAFGSAEIAALFAEVYGRELSAVQVAALADRTEGWPIALQLVWQGLRSWAARSPDELLAAGSPSLDALFDYLAHDVLESLPPELATFLRETAILRELTPAAADAVTGGASSALLLDRLLELDLFLVATGEGHYRYHHLFHDFLRERAGLSVAATRERHRRAAEYFVGAGAYEEAIYHWLAAEELEQVAVAVERAGEATLRQGWLQTVATWIDTLPPAVLAEHPLLQAYMGDICRMHSRFEEALGWYTQAEQTWRGRDDLAGISRALHGQALVYLDTVRPAQAEHYLEEALRLSEGLPDRQARARLLELMAENKLNMGKPDEAEALRGDAQAIREQGSAEDALSVRVKLRTGQLDAAQRTLESWVAAERLEVELGQLHPPRAHRETLLLLSLIHALRGDAEAAFSMAQEGIAVGARLNSPFVTAVGHVRLGHAWQLRAGAAHDTAGRAALEEAIRCYGQGIDVGDRIRVRRIRAEAMWGLTRAYGLSGDLAAAAQAAAEGSEIGRAAGDVWITALIGLALGSSYILAGQPDAAVESLTRVLAEFRDCGDSFGRAVSRLWLALAYNELGQGELCLAALENGLRLCEQQGYSALFAGPSLVGPPDPRRLAPLLIAARDRLHSSYAARVLAEIGLPEIQVHPGYQLRVQTLGAFVVTRGDKEIEPRDWQRDKARQLFQLLLTERSRWMQREEIVERLWPALPADAAGRDFKVALHSLNRAIEPERSHDALFAFVERQGTAYRLRPEADLWLDAQVFEQECHAAMRKIDAGTKAGGIAQLGAALQLYAGDYLPDAIYEDWASVERERLLSLYLRAADKLAATLMAQGSYDAALDIAQEILARDPCWENAYRWMMLAHAQQGNRTLALRVYSRYCAVMRSQLGVGPSPATSQLYERLLSGAP